MPMALTLRKVDDKNAQMQFEQPKFGEHGGSIALIAGGEVETKFFAEHNAATQYEIGSITKTMTAYLLAKQLANGSIEQNTTTDMFFKQGPAIRIVDLATHTSGLERNPPSLAEATDISNPFANVSRQSLESDLGLVSLSRAEQGHLYSNFAYAVLGEVLAMNHQSTLSDEFDANIFKPLQMSDSYLADEPSKRSKNLAQGHNTLGDSVGPWDFAAASGAGAVVSNLSDMLTYTRHMILEAKSNTALAQRLFSPYIEIGGCCEQALGWIIMKDKSGKPYAWHNGMTNGFSAFLGFYLDGSRALVMLNNQASSFDKLAHAILTGETGLHTI
jgi:CubicO group peptidase (beta-lactamase class C family)